MKLQLILPLSVAASSLLAGCGAFETKAPSSSTRDIATDLDGDAAGEATYLYWVKDGMVNQGRCDVSPIVLANCQADLRSMPFEAFSAALSSGISGSLSDLQTRIPAMKASIGELAVQIADLEASLSVAQPDVEAKTAAKAQAEAELASIESNIAALSAQIQIINGKLAQTPNDQDLVALKIQVQADITSETAKKAPAQAKVAEASQALTTASALVQDLSVKKANGIASYEAKKAELKAAEAALAVAEQEKIHLDSTLAKLSEETIVYRVQSTTDSFKDLKPYVSRFKTIFATGAVIDLSQTYDNLDILVPATGTTGTVDFPIDFAAAGKVEDVVLQYKMTHSSPSDLTINLIAPDGTSNLIRSGSSGGLNEIVSATGVTEPGFTWRLAGFQSLQGKSTNGTWKLSIRDSSSGDSGRLQFVKLTLKVKVGG